MIFPALILMNETDKINLGCSQSYERVIKKIDEIVKSFDIEHYKNLKYELKEFKRVHVGEKVLVFKFDKKINLIKFIDFDHHDNIYKKKF